MHFENYEPVQYKHNILFNVVFQARFPEIMRIEHEPPNVICRSNRSITPP